MPLCTVLISLASARVTSYWWSEFSVPKSVFPTIPSPFEHGFDMTEPCFPVEMLMLPSSLGLSQVQAPVWPVNFWPPHALGERMDVIGLQSNLVAFI